MNNEEKNMNDNKPAALPGSSTNNGTVISENPAEVDTQQVPIEQAQNVTPVVSNTPIFQNVPEPKLQISETIVPNNQTQSSQPVVDTFGVANDIVKEPKEKKKHTLAIVMVLLILLAAGFMVYYFYFMNKDEKDVTPNDSKVVENTEEKETTKITLQNKNKDVVDLNELGTESTFLNDAGEETGGIYKLIDGNNIYIIEYISNYDDHASIINVYNNKGNKINTVNGALEFESFTISDNKFYKAKALETRRGTSASYSYVLDSNFNVLVRSSDTDSYPDDYMDIIVNKDNFMIWRNELSEKSFEVFDSNGKKIFTSTSYDSIYGITNNYAVAKTGNNLLFVDVTGVETIVKELTEKESVFSCPFNYAISSINSNPIVDIENSDTNECTEYKYNTSLKKIETSTCSICNS